MTNNPTPVQQRSRKCWEIPVACLLFLGLSLIHYRSLVPLTELGDRIYKEDAVSSEWR